MKDQRTQYWNVVRSFTIHTNHTRQEYARWLVLDASLG